MPNDSKTFIVNDQPTDKDALDFTPYVALTPPTHNLSKYAGIIDATGL